VGGTSVRLPVSEARLIEDPPFAVCYRNGNVGFSGFSETVDGVAHDRDSQWGGDVVEGSFDLGGSAVDVDLGPQRAARCPIG
jgi:hypothetical protein